MVRVCYLSQPESIVNFALQIIKFLINIFLVSMNETATISGGEAMV